MQSLFVELKNKIEEHRFNVLKNAPPKQWPLIIQLIKECETDEHKVQMYSKQINVIRKMIFQYDEIIKMQNAELTKLENNSESNCEEDSVIIID